MNDAQLSQQLRALRQPAPDDGFEARLQQLSPVATTSVLNPRVRSFLAIFTIMGSDEHLLPDLAAAIDVPQEGSR